MKTKLNLYKKVFVMILSVVIAVSFVVPDLTAFAAQTAYTAVKLDMPSVAASDPSFGLKYEETALNENVKTMTLHYAWSGSVSKNNTTQYMYVATENSNSTQKVYDFGTDSAVMFYAKFPADVQKQEMFFQMVASNRGDPKKYGKEQWIQVGSNKKVYYLLNGDTEWQEKTTPVSTVGGTLGNLEFTGGFEGWVRIPYESFNIDESLSTSVFRFEFRPKHLGGDYTPKDLKSGSVSYGSMMIVSSGTKDYKKISVDGNEIDLVHELYCHRTDTFVPTAADHLKTTDNLTMFSDGYTHTATDSTFGYTFDQKKVLAGKNGSIITYVNLPIDKADSLQVKINGTAVKNDTKCYLINRGDSEWRETAVTDGKITLPKGFEGYLQIPVAGVTGLAGKSVDKVSFSSQLKDVKVGSVLVSAIFDNVVILRTKENNATYNLVTKPYYNAALLETAGTTTTPEGNTYYTVSAKKQSSSFSMGIDNGYSYTFSGGTAAVGHYTVKSSAKDIPYTGHLAEGFTLPSGKATRPFNATAIAFSGMNDVAAPFAAKGFTLSVGKVTTGTKDNVYLKSGKYVNAGVANGATVDDKYYAQVNFNGINWTQNGAVLFYVKHTKTGASAKETKLYLINQTKWTCLTKDMPYYTLKDGDTQWQTCTTAQNSGSAGDLVIPANFSGWIRIPTADFKLYNGTGKTEADHQLTGIQFFPYALGKEYGSLTISHIMTVDDGKNNHYSVKFGTGKEEKLADAGEKSFSVDVTAFNGGTVFSTDAEIVDMNTAFAVSTAGKLASDQALMVYVRKNGRSASRFILSLGKDHARLNGSSKYYLYSAENEVWQSATADESGRMEIPADFSGWIRIPYAGLVDDSGEPLKDTLSFDRINILPTELGGSYGELSVGSFMIVNHSLLDLPTMRVDSAAEIKLTGNNYYSALMPELSEVLACGDVARTVTVSSENCDFFKGGCLYTVSPKNPSVISMGAEDGVEVAFREELNITGKNGLLMYVALPDTANTVRIGGAFALSAGKPVYVLGAGNDAVWEKQKVATGGAISLPAGFKGYIRFPFASMKQQPTDDIKKFVVSFTSVGGKDGNPK